MKLPSVQVGRIAMRHEGQMWNAYYALPDTMEKPIFLGSINIGAVVDNPARKRGLHAHDARHRQRHHRGLDRNSADMGRAAISP